ncbi:hypothetical protein WMF27_13945 [Sorangium sp. So ce281]|uniref:hypothetical protein n=1 Tax=unclassified Sorangium TaxID=2621164 RepID=UPI003F6161C9
MGLSLIVHARDRAGEDLQAARNDLAEQLGKRVLPAGTDDRGVVRERGEEIRLGT